MESWDKGEHTAIAATVQLSHMASQYKMPNSQYKNVPKARVFNNLKRNVPEQPRESESIAVGENCIQEFGCRKAN